MKHCKRDFIDFLHRSGALGFGRFELKNKNISPYFVNLGKADDGEKSIILGKVYANMIIDHFKEDEYDIIFGPAYKGITLSEATSTNLFSEHGINKKFRYNRKEAKTRGEATDKKELFSGEIEYGNSIIFVDDVFSSGKTKYEIIDLLEDLKKDLKYKAVIVGVDRQETYNRKNAVEAFTKETGIPVYPIVNIAEIRSHLYDKLTNENKKSLDDYLMINGNEEIKKIVSKLLP